jgi:hypothetical protein
MTTVKAYPTKYDRVRFRSRLEARWAAFFDLVGWQWEYEPIDLAGYIPDFIIHGKRQCKRLPILVEVKPIEGDHDPLLERTQAKIEQCGWKSEALILSYFFPEDEYNCRYLGWLGEFWPAEVMGEDQLSIDSFAWGYASFQSVRDDHKARFGFCHNEMSYTDRISGFYDGSCGSFIAEAGDLWREAGNRVQWNAPDEAA